MLEQLIYKNHQNEIFELGNNGIYVNSSNIHDYDWSTTTKGSRISDIKRKVSTKTLPIIILCETEEKGIAARNRLFEVVEKDVLAMKPGQIIVGGSVVGGNVTGGYYFKCFVTKSKKSSYLISKKYLAINLTLTSDFPYWVKESTKSFGIEDTTSATGLDYEHDFPFDYTLGAAASVNNTSFVASNFRLIIYGACTNPLVTIGGHTYQVNCTVEAGEYIVVDSVTKTIKLVATNGATINKFNDRNKESYIFEKIPSGISVATWSGDFGFDVILLEERSEPKWT